MRVTAQSLGAGSRAQGRGEGRCMVRWLTLAGGAALLAGCVAPPYPPYPTPLYLPPPYVAQPPYAAQPPVALPQSGPAPLYPAPEPRREAAPTPEISVDPLPDPEPVPESTPEAEAPAASNPAPAAPAPEAVPPPPTQAGPGADAPLQGFRPMRGQTRPGI